MKINLDTLKDATTCQKRWFISRWGRDFEFESVAELIEATKQLEQPPTYIEMLSLLLQVPELQTKETFEYLKSRDLLVRHVRELIEVCTAYQTDEMFEYFTSQKPSAWDVAWVLGNCPKFQTKEKLDYYNSLNPSKMTEKLAKENFPEVFEEAK